MAYVDEVYYNDSFSGEPVDTTDFPSLCRRAEEIIEEMTLYRVTPVTFPAMPEDMQTRIKDAVCAQIEYLDANGGADLDMGDGLAGASLGKFSYTGASSGSGSTVQSIVAPRAERILWPTGLTMPGDLRHWMRVQSLLMSAWNRQVRSSGIRTMRRSSWRQHCFLIANIAALQRWRFSWMILLSSMVRSSVYSS